MQLSYTSINSYETCPAKYRFQYEERVPGRPSPALAFGDSLHQALHRFHARPVPVAPPLPELWETLDDVWVSEGYVDPSEERLYREHAREVLARYHRDNADRYRIPAALEFRFRVEVEGVALTGVIDRMDRLPGGGYEIIDYKTNRRLPPRDRLEGDLQLSLYAYAAREVWGIEPERLTLYFLLPGQRMSTSRTAGDLENLRRRVANIAERIEAGRFEPRENPLCDWCDYQHLCPLFRHRYERENAPPRIAEVVEEWIALKREDRARWRRLEELAATIKAYAEEHGLGRLYGSDGAIKVVQRVDTAPDPAAVRRHLEPLGLYESVLAVDPRKLHDLIESRTLPPHVEDALLASREEVRTTKALYLTDADRAGRRR
ncbi:MAG TPA: PD-(D/E)XK nuclease family protein [Actinomycetota bacterium]|nr:PD-(D/E)XK nuclease family protein [Actinomycetota bacterium]